MLEEERNRNDNTNRALYELIVVRFSCILIIPIMHVMFALLSNMTDSCEPNVQTICEKNGQAAPPMPQIAPATTVSLI